MKALIINYIQNFDDEPKLFVTLYYLLVSPHLNFVVTQPRSYRGESII